MPVPAIIIARRRAFPNPTCSPAIGSLDLSVLLKRSNNVATLNNVTANYQRSFGFTDNEVNADARAGLRIPVEQRSLDGHARFSVHACVTFSGRFIVIEPIETVYTTLN